MIRRIIALVPRFSVASFLLLLSGCASTPPEYTNDPPSPVQAIPAFQGSYHTVRPGETLWRIAHSYGLNPHQLAAANRLQAANQVVAGEQLFIPLPPESNRFLWPVRGSVGISSSGGIDIAASPGSLIRASRTGRVAVATSRLSGWGKTVVLDHLDGYVTVYAGLDQILVAPGAQLRQGVPLGTAGSQALHFEIRNGMTPRNTIALLPAGN